MLWTFLVTKHNTPFSYKQQITQHPSMFWNHRSNGVGNVSFYFTQSLFNTHIKLSILKSISIKFILSLTFNTVILNISKKKKKSYINEFDYRNLILLFYEIWLNICTSVTFFLTIKYFISIYFERETNIYKEMTFGQRKQTQPYISLWDVPLKQNWPFLWLGKQEKSFNSKKHIFLKNSHLDCM